MSVNLEKGQKISLEKQVDGTLSEIFVGCGWSPARNIFGISKGSIDLDLSALLFNEQKEPVDKVWFRQLASRDGSVRHSGDNRTGQGDGDDEVISLNLSRLPANIKHIVFTISSFTGQSFDKVADAFCRVVDAKSNKELVNYQLVSKGNHTGMIMARLYNHNGEWKAQAIGEFCQSRTVDDLISVAQGTF